MSLAAPRIAELPSAFAIFPLTGALLLPRGRLPLNIFEPRYLAMTEDALANGRMFAMIQPDRAQPMGPTGPATYRIGCLGRLSSFSETDDGRFLITLTGLIRFTVVEELEMRRGYRRVRASFDGFESDLASPDLGGFDRAALLAALRTYFARRAIDANWEAIEGMAHDTLVTTLAMVCPFDAAEKQALLETASAMDRYATLLTLLQIDSHADHDSDGRRQAS